MASRVVETLITEFKIKATEAVEKLKQLSKEHKNHSINLMSGLRTMNLFSSMLNKLAFGFSLLSGAIIGFGAKALTEFGKVEAMRSVLKGLLGDAELAKEMFNKLEDISFSSGIADMKDLVEEFVKINELVQNPDWTVHLLGTFSEQAKRTSKDVADLKQGLGILKRWMEIGTLENRGINLLQSAFPEINKMAMQAFGTEDIADVLKSGVDPVEIIHRLIQEFDKLPKSADKFKDSWARFTGELDLAFAKFGEQLAKYVLPLINDVSLALQNMFRNMDMTDTGGISQSDINSFREGLASAIATFLQLPTVIVNFATEMMIFVSKLKIAGDFIGGFVLILGTGIGAIAKTIGFLINYVATISTFGGIPLVPIGFDDERNAFEQWDKTSFENVKELTNLEALKMGNKSWDADKFESDKNKTLGLFSNDKTLSGKSGVPGMPHLEKNPQLAEIERYTRETSKNTEKMNDHILGGGSLAAKGVSAYDMSVGGNSELSQAVDLIYKFVLKTSMGVQISRSR